MNAVKHSIVKLSATSATEAGEALTLERNAAITLKEGEDFPPSIIVSDVEFDSAMASVKHEREREAKKLKALQELEQAAKGGGE